MIKAYTYKLKPNKSVQNKFEQWVGICRFVYNCAKDLKEQSYKKGIKLSNFDIQKQLTPAKNEILWLKEVGVGTHQEVIDRLDDSFKKFYKGSGYPKWATKKKWKSIPFKSIKTTHNAFNLPKFGIVKVFNFKIPKGELRTASIVKEADGLYLKIIVKEQEVEQIREKQSVCAIDMGIKYFLTTSDGEFVDNPKHLFNYLKQLRIENRKLARMKRGGSNYRKQVKRLQLLHQKISRIRKDFLHKQSRILANNYGIIIREDLDISKMIKGSKLAKYILDCSWGTFFEFLEYKTKIIKVNPSFTSQKCSKCGHTCKENRKTQSLFECISCGYSENADLQATFNILQLGQQLMEANVKQ